MNISDWRILYRDQLDQDRTSGSIPSKGKPRSSRRVTCIIGSVLNYTELKGLGAKPCPREKLCVGCPPTSKDVNVLVPPYGSPSAALAVINWTRAAQQAGRQSVLSWRMSPTTAVSIGMLATLVAFRSGRHRACLSFGRRQNPHRPKPSRPQTRTVEPPRDQGAYPAI